MIFFLRILYITPVINIQLHCAMETDDKNLLLQQPKKKQLHYVLGIWLLRFQMCSGKLMPVRAGDSCLCNSLDIYINMKIGAGPCVLTCSKARTRSKVKRRADLRGAEFSCPTLTRLHKLQDYEVFSILFPNGRREKRVVRVTY